ncbi:MAG: NAD-dependent epimerase/dehydratase family protein [Polyangiaceae bacterium]
MSAQNFPAHWLVTGGVGFIGYHATRALLARGGRVTVVDDFCDAPYPRVEKERNQRDLVAEFGDKIRIEVGGVEDRSRMAEVFAAAATAEPFGGVLHLAGLAGVRPSFGDPARYARVNVEGTTTLLELARAAGVPRFVFASSSSVYGNSTPLPAREDAAAIEPESPYAASKRGAELVALSLARRAPTMSITGLRFFTVYGPRQRPEMAITLFTRKALKNEPIAMFGDGSMKRDFTHVDDIVAGILAAVDRAPEGFRVYNLGSGAPIRLVDLVTAIGAAVGREIKVERQPVPLGDVDATFADVSRAKAELGWAPRIALVDGLQTVADWVRQVG